MKPILIHHVIVGFPIIRITGIGQSAMTGEEYLAHADCFLNKMQSGKPVNILQLNGKQ